MYLLKFKFVAVSSVALAALLTLGACGKKVSENATPGSAPMSSPSTNNSSTGTSGAMPPSSGAGGTSR